MVSIHSVFAASAAITLVSASQLVARNTEPLPACIDYTPFTYAGCFTDPQNPDRALPFESKLDFGTMTIEACVSLCKGNNYRYAGLEYYGQCFCGASVSGAKTDESQCSYPCNGNSTEVCGGNSVLSVYQDPTFNPTVDDQSPTTDYQYAGCYTEAVDNLRALVYRQDQIDGSTLTTEICLAACKSKGYPLAGTEFSSECYCGVVLGNGTMEADPSDCNKPCNGNSAETCGGSARLSLWVAKDLESSQPCVNGSAVPPTTVTSTTTSITITTSTSTTIVVPTTTSTTSTTVSTTSTTSSTSISTSTSTTSSTKSTSSTTSTTSSTTSVLSTTSTSTSTTVKITTTSAPTTTSTTAKLTTTSSAPAICTTVAPPACEYKCGNWCSNPLPPFTEPNSCLTAASNCIVQVSACWAKAGFPDSLNCFKYANWCLSVWSYCKDSSGCASGKCGNEDCKKRTPPQKPNDGRGECTTSTYVCPTSTKGVATTTKATSTTTSCAVPTPSNICKQPTNKQYQYDINAPVGGIALPCLTCNNLKPDYDGGAIFKLYTDSDTNKCSSYKKPNVPKACKDACLAQYTSCLGTYAEGCRGKRQSYYQDSYDSACDRCKVQYQDCLDENSSPNVSPSRCGGWNQGWF